MEDELEEYLYHVTYLKDLDSIQESGLRPGRGQTFSGGYAGHASGRVFYTSADGVKFWAQRYGEMADSNTDNPEEGWVPVVLRIDVDFLGEVYPDEPGSKDASAPAFFSEVTLSSEYFDVWNGSKWVELPDADIEAMMEAMLEASEYEQDDEDDEEGWYIVDSDVFLPEDDQL
jgi:hypothetical protein